MANIQEVKGKKGTKYRALIRLKVNGQHVVESATFARKTDAKKWASQMETDIHEGRYFKTAEAKKHTVSDVIDRFIKHELKDKKSASDTERQLLFWKKEIGEKTLAEVDPALITEIRDKLLNEPIITMRKDPNDKNKVIETRRQRNNATVNRYMAALSSVLSKASREWGYIEVNPISKVKKKTESKGRVRFLDDDERVRFLAACKESKNPYLYPVVVVALATGMRKGEILNLTWSDIDFPRRRILLSETKNGERRSVFLEGKALEILKDHKERQKEKKVQKITNLVFPGSHALNTGPTSLRTAFLHAVKRAGLVDFHFHDLRHSCASYLAMNGATLAEIAEVLGHKTLTMVQRYSHLSDKHVSGVVASMNRKIFGEGE